MHQTVYAFNLLFHRLYDLGCYYEVATGNIDGGNYILHHNFPGRSGIQD